MSSALLTLDWPQNMARQLLHDSHPASLPDFPGNEGSWAVALSWGWDDAATSHSDNKHGRQGATLSWLSYAVSCSPNMTSSGRNEAESGSPRAIALRWVAPKIPISLALDFLYQPRVLCRLT